jgi:mRNA-degrading endonuclease RelE of RelBE toxin-antitoxin system
MEFRIADTFTDSLARLTVDEQKIVKTTAFDLQIDPSRPSMQFHKLDKAKDKNLWSVRVSRDIRLIVHKTESSLLLCYVDHHDRAYDWAERRKIETHPTTGAAQIVEIRETVKEVVIPVYVGGQVSKSAVTPGTRLFADVKDIEFLAFGVPAEWINDVKNATEDTLLNLTDHLPSEAAEALLELATGGKPRPAASSAELTSPFEHPDAQRRFRLMTGIEALEQALEFPWEKWTIFLHPEQQQWVERDYAGPARVAGSAGTGKTIVALHRAAYLARSNPDARVLLTTFSDPLASSLHSKLKRLIGNNPRVGERIDVYSLDAIGRRLYKAHVGPADIASRSVIREALETAASSVSGHAFGLRFLLAEWEQVVDAWQLDSWEAYRDVARLGRKTRLAESQREVLWKIFERVFADLEDRQVITMPQMFGALTDALAEKKNVIFDYVIVDEAQDVSVAQLRFLAALGGDRPNALFFAGDLGQRIFQQPFSWRSLGVDVRGRSRTLRVNYRTSHQIRTQADRLLGHVVTDIDGNVEDRRGTVSVFNGPPPTIISLSNESEEAKAVAGWVQEQTVADLRPHEFGIFVRSEAQLDRARSAADASGLPYKILDEEHVDTTSGHIAIGTMHLAKGLEFRAVVVMACDDEVVPLQERIETVGDEADLQEVYETERHLLYVACTRARDHLLITGVKPLSEFLDDMTVPVPEV